MLYFALTHQSVSTEINDIFSQCEDIGIPIYITISNIPEGIRKNTEWDLDFLTNISKIYLTFTFPIAIRSLPVYIQQFISIATKITLKIPKEDPFTIKDFVILPDINLKYLHIEPATILDNVYLISFFNETKSLTSFNFHSYSYNREDIVKLGSELEPLLTRVKTLYTVDHEHIVFKNKKGERIKFTNLQNIVVYLSDMKNIIKNLTEFNTQLQKVKLIADPLAPFNKENTTYILHNILNYLSVKKIIIDIHDAGTNFAENHKLIIILLYTNYFTEEIKLPMSFYKDKFNPYNRILTCLLDRNKYINQILLIKNKNIELYNSSLRIYSDILNNTNTLLDEHSLNTYFLDKTERNYIWSIIILIKKILLKNSEFVILHMNFDFFDLKLNFHVDIFNFLNIPIPAQIQYDLTEQQNILLSNMSEIRMRNMLKNVKQRTLEIKQEEYGYKRQPTNDEMMRRTFDDDAYNQYITMELQKDTKAEFQRDFSNKLAKIDKEMTYLIKEMKESKEPIKEEEKEEDERKRIEIELEFREKKRREKELELHKQEIIGLRRLREFEKRKKIQVFEDKSKKKPKDKEKEDNASVKIITNQISSSLVIF